MAVFFLQQDVEIDFAGWIRIKSRELIGYDPETKPLPYKWDLQDDTLTISVTYSAMDLALSGNFSKDGNSISGGWRPNPGADETVILPYDIGGNRVK